MPPAAPAPGEADDRPLALILAAGLGTRMRSNRAKVLHPLCGRAMLSWVVGAAHQAGFRVALVLHHQADAVHALHPQVPAAHQKSPQGTGDAVRAAAHLLPEQGPVVVLPGDTPLLHPHILTALREGHREALCTVLTTELADPGAFGRVVREGGQVRRIVEHQEATAEQRAIREVNTGIYCFEAGWLRREVLPRLVPHPPKSEYYITDAVEAAASRGALGAVLHPDSEALVGVNDRWYLAWAEDRLQERILRNHARQGVTLHRPHTLRVEAEVSLEPDVVLDPGVVLSGDTHLGEGVHVGTGSVLRDVTATAHCRIAPYTVAEGARLEGPCAVGPFARLRQGTRVEPGARVGNFVETKNCHLGAGAKASHLTYLGDARIGSGVNVGAGTITCNYDGFAKHRTVIEKSAFIGSNTALVAPVSVGTGAIVGAGSVIVHDVPDHCLSVARGRQEDHHHLAPRLRKHYTARAEQSAGQSAGKGGESEGNGS